MRVGNSCRKPDTSGVRVGRSCGLLIAGGQGEAINSVEYTCKETVEQSRGMEDSKKTTPSKHSRTNTLMNSQRLRQDAPGLY